MCRFPIVAILRSLLVVLGMASFCLSRSASAATLYPQWAPNGIAVKALPSNASSVALVPDESGGVYVAWIDRTPGETSDHVRVTHLMPDGTRDSRWPTEGVRVGGSNGLAFFDTDHAGGFYISVNTNGTRIARYTAAGIPVQGWGQDGGVSIPSYYHLAIDAGGRIWAFAPFPKRICFGGPDCFYWWELLTLRLGLDGASLPGWDAPGKPLRVLFGRDCSMTNVSYHGTPGGLRLGFRFAIYDRFFSYGTALFQFNDDGTIGTLYQDSVPQEFGSSVMAMDSAQRHFIGISYFDPGYRVARWNGGGLWNPEPFLTLPGAVSAVPLGLVPDETGGVFAVSAWEFADRARANRVTHLSSDGQIDTRWPVAGLSLDGVDSTRTAGHRFVSDRSGGFFAVWHDSRGGDADIYALQLDLAGNAPPNWPVSGYPVSRIPGSSQTSPAAAADHLGNIFVAWRDTRQGEPNIAAQRFSTALPVSAQVLRSSGRVEGSQVVLEWELSESPSPEVRVERRVHGADWELVGELTPGNARGLWTFRDETPPRSRSIEYQLHDLQTAWTAGGIVVESPVVASLGVFGPTPNPWRPGAAFALVAPQAGKLTWLVHDVSGRVQQAGERSVEAGSNRFELPVASPMRPGLYWLSVRTSDRVFMRRFVVTK